MPAAVSIEIPRSDPLFAALPASCVGSATHVLARDAADRLELRRVQDRLGLGIRVDLGAIALGSALALRRQPMLRALGDAAHVVDATAGLLGDAWLIAASGRQVFAVERDPFVHALAHDGLTRALRDDALRAIASRIELHAMDAEVAFASLRARGFTTPSTAILLDPMFPPKRKKSALPPKEMQVLKELLGMPTLEVRVDSERTLLASARATGVARVIVKRPDHAGDFAGVLPSWSTHGTLVRFDVYASQEGAGTHG